MLRSVIISFFVLIFSNNVFSQIDISFPSSRIVFQRDLANKANVPIAGNLTVVCDYVEARLSPLNGYQGTDTGWKVITNSSLNGFYQGEIGALGGWYKLEVRAFNAGEQVGYSSLDRIGVGEVFAVAGQSNAEGQSVYEGAIKGVTDDRISVINYHDSEMEENKLPFEFSKLNDNTKIGPYNPVPWIWAVMAEKIVKEQGVPVLIYGCAVGGTSSSLWNRSARGEDLRSVEALLIKFDGSPYQVLGRTLRNYASRTGIRAILWQQGESDFNNTEENYFNNVKYVIEQSRRDIKGDVPWVIAESSRTPNPSYSVTVAQKKLAENVPFTFKGPNTDLIYGTDLRFDGIHFHKDGITQAGNAWSNALKAASLYTLAAPVSHKGIANISFECASNNEDVNIRINQSGIRANWTNGSSLASAQISSGPIDAIVYNSDGLRINFPSLRIRSKDDIKPGIQLEGESSFCEDKSSKIIASNSRDVTWQNGEKVNQIFPKTTGSYFFQAKNVYGCDFESNKIDISVYSKPKPELNFSDGIQRICEGTSIEVKTTNQFANILWEDGSTTPTRSITATGNYNLKVTSENGCESDLVDFRIETLERPVAPVVNKIGYFVLEASSELNSDDKIEWFGGDQKLEFSNNTIRANTSGVYKARIQKSSQFNNQTITCPSSFSNDVAVVVGNEKIVAYPNPTRGEVNIESFYDEPKMEVWLYTIKGSLVSKSTISPPSDINKLTFDNIPNGIYVLNIKAGLFWYRKPLIIQK